jgi:hypothetical protein
MCGIKYIFGILVYSKEYTFPILFLFILTSFSDCSMLPFQSSSHVT